MSRTVRRSVVLLGAIGFGAFGAVTGAVIDARTAEAQTRAGHRDAAFEAKIEGELRALAPDAVPTFEQATTALDDGKYGDAVDLFGTVIQAAPGFSHAKRRECSALLADGKRAAAIPFCRAALAQDESPENQAALSATLAAMGQGITPTESDAREAKALAEKAVAAKPGDAFAWHALFQAALVTDDRDAMTRSSARIDSLEPTEPSTYVIDAMLAGSRGDESAALAALDRAEEHGLSKEEHARMATAFGTMLARPWWLVAGSFLGRAFAAWLLLLGVLLGAGYALSRITLRAVATRATDANLRPHETWLRRIYRALIVAASAFYYASLPLLVISVVGMVVGVIGGIIAAGWIAPKLFIIVALVGGSSLFAIGRSLFVRPRNEDPGVTLDLAKNPALERTLAEVAGRIGTRPVDRVFVTPFTDVAVFDRGGLVAQLRGTSERCLVLGVGVLEGMRVCALKSVLAHEYGHFRNEDTAGGGFALAVRRSLSAMTIALVQGGAASAINPAWWFVRGYSRAFYGISQGASRLQEVLADRWAAFAYGSSVFEEGLRHVIARDVRFGAHVDCAINEVVDNRRPLPNLYAFAPAIGVEPPVLERTIGDALAKPASVYDSHPSPADRLAWVRALGAECPPSRANDDDDAWSLFADRAALEARMTDDVRARVKRIHGVVIPAD